MLLGNRAGTMEARPDVLLIVWDVLVFLDVPLVPNEQTSNINTAIPKLNYAQAQKQITGNHRQLKLIMRYKTYLKCQGSLLTQPPIHRYPTGRYFMIHKLTLSRMMSISEYFIPLTSTGVSLEKTNHETKVQG